MNKDELEQRVSDKRIMLAEDVEWTNDKLVKILGDYTISHSPSNKYSWGARYIQSLETVQLCRHLKNEKKVFDKGGVDPMTSDDYISELKENGSRVFVYYDPAVGFEFYSRRESVFTQLNNNYTKNVLLINKGLITSPDMYIGKYNMRFILDGEITVDGIHSGVIFDGVQYKNIDDLMQAIIGSNQDRAYHFQKSGHSLKFNIFDIVYYEDNLKEVPPIPTYDYYQTTKDLTDEELAWVKATFADYLRTSCIPEKYSNKTKLIYNYLASLRDTLPGDLRKYPFAKRRKLRRKLVEFLQTKNLPFVEVPGEDKDKAAYLDEVLSNKCEGIILKNLHAPYISALKSSRTHRACLKVKQSISTLLLNSDIDSDFDVIITGINKPKSKNVTDMIGALNVSVYIQDNGKTELKEIASVSGIPHEWKRKLTSFDEDGNMILNPEYYGKVIAIDGMALTHKLKFQHAVLSNPSDLVFKDKEPTDCTWDKAVLEQLVITRGYNS